MSGLFVLLLDMDEEWQCFTMAESLHVVIASILHTSARANTWADRLARRADKIREYLCWQPGIFNSTDVMPTGMHWHIYDHLYTQYELFANGTLQEMGRRIGTAKR